MIIPQSILNQIAENANPMDNKYFNHAISDLNSLNKVTEETFCYGDISRAANILERLYKGFLYAGEKQCDWYQLPIPDFLTNDHNILKLVIEIKDSFPNFLPRLSREEWRETKTFLKDLRQEYTNSRYSSYPTFEELISIRKYINNQFELISEYIKSDKFTELDLENDDLQEDY